MKICPLMSNSEGSIDCTSECNWFDQQKGGCIVISIKSLLDEVCNHTNSIDDNVSWIESRSS